MGFIHEIVEHLQIVRLTDASSRTTVHIAQKKENTFHRRRFTLQWLEEPRRLCWCDANKLHEIVHCEMVNEPFVNIVSKLFFVVHFEWK